MEPLDRAKASVNKLTAFTKPIENLGATLRTKGIWWEIGAYITRTLGVAIPVVVLNTINGTWRTNGIGLTTTLLFILLIFVYKAEIKKLSNYAPGVIPFTIFLVVAYFMYSTARTLMIIGASGLAGTIIASPMHIQYLNTINKKEKLPSAELLALQEIAAKLTKEP